ncbi:CAP domain-containing protein [Tenacibaculum agarivorans]|uniref:CAP domain-containing protein n=1 Tax=Tenacibaculum agarivorans TaxID=1908389 RepID=UPI00094B8714|nr:CAP domain-containing protein [Tenacibaculum agarivorans]
MILRKYLFIFSVFLMVSCTSEDPQIDGVNENPDTNVGTDASYEGQILQLLNNHRASKGLAKLEVLDIIKSQTDKHTDYMISAGAISHANFSDRGKYLSDNAGAKNIGENVAVGYNTAQSVVTGWINSDGHRKNIEGNFTHFNLTAKQNSNGRWYYTNIFIRK